MSLQKGLVGHWTMDSIDVDSGVIRDKSARDNHADINGPITDVPGKTGDAISLGGDDYLLGPDIPETRTNPFTATVWVLLSENIPWSNSSVKNLSPLCVRDDTNVKWSIHYRNPDDSQSRSFQIYTDNNGNLLSDDSFNQGEWYFIAAIDDGSDLKLRVNDSVYTNPNGGGTTFSSGGSVPLQIGKTGNGSEQWRGRIGEVRYYDRVLNTAELDKLYNIRNRREYGSPYTPRKPVAASNLVAWYPFEGRASDATAFQTWAADNTDYSGTVNGATELDSGGINDIRSGTNSGAFDFDGSDNIRFDTLDGVDFAQDGGTTIMYWFYNNNIGSREELLSRYQPDRGITTHITGDLKHNWVTGDSGGNNNIVTSINEDQWHHAALSYDNSTNINSCYLDGEFIGDFTQNFNTSTQDSMYLGEASFGGNNLSGLLDDVRIYNRPLTESETSSIYNNTKP